MERLRHKPSIKKRIIVVCVEGVATAWLLVSRIRAELPDLDIVQVLSLLEMENRKDSFDSIDAIVTTIPIESTRSCHFRKTFLGSRRYHQD